MNVRAEDGWFWGSRARFARGCGFALASWFAQGCGDPLVDAAVVVGPRVLGARVRTANDALVAEPGAGESAQIEWLVVSNVRGAFASALSFCVAEPSLLGAPRCDGAAFDEQVVKGQFGVGLAADFRLPAELAPGDRWLAWFGSCGETAALFDDERSEFLCADKSAARSAFYRGRVPGPDASGNRNPELDDDLLLLDAARWAGPGEPLGVGEPCQGSGLPERRGGTRAAIEFQLAGDDREALQPPGAGDYRPRARESLVYTHVANFEGLERPFSAIEHDGDELGFALELALPALGTADSEGQTLAFYLLVRDERGGVDWTERQLCVLNP